jgi:hypothetical protein
LRRQPQHLAYVLDGTSITNVYEKCQLELWSNAPSMS